MSEHSWLYKLTHLLSREPHSQSQLIDILRDAEQRHLLDQDALQMIEGVLAVADKKVRDVMIPHPQMIVIEADAKPADALPVIIHSQHSRFPVIGDTPDTVIGILLAKDLLPALVEQKTKESFIRDFIRPPIFIPESKRLDVLLKEFRQNRNHMAIVVDEYGMTSGLITIEDVLEEIVGEYTTDSAALSKDINLQEDGSYIIDASITLRTLRRLLGWHLPAMGPRTLSGLIIEYLGYIPPASCCMRIEGFQIEILMVSDNMIKTVRMASLIHLKKR